MTDMGETRKNNLRRLIDDQYGGVVNRLAAEVQAPHSAIWRLLAENKTANSRTMGEKMARRIERACGLDEGWMDRDPSAQTSEESSALAERILALPEPDRAAVLRMVQALSSDVE